MQTNIPEFEELDLDTFYKEWQQRVPIGWVEHRQAWSLSGDYGKWVEDNQVAVQVNDTIFLHGGISQKYCKFSLESLTDQVQAVMKNYDPAVTTILDDPLGPLWYRGYAEEEKTELYKQTLENILNRYGAKRLVVGHSPTGGAVWPRFDQKIVLNDSGIASHYGSHNGVLELTAEGATAIYADQRIPLPTTDAERVDYLRAVIAVDSNNDQLKKRLAKMLAPPPVTGNEASAAGHVSGPVEQGVAQNTEANASPGNCQ